MKVTVNTGININNFLFSVFAVNNMNALMINSQCTTSTTFSLIQEQSFNKLL
eukprot:Pgem_evm1s5656